MNEFEKEYWDSRYKAGQTSGSGSYGSELEKKLDYLKYLDIKSISEIGCGDLNFARSLMEQYKDRTITYNGQDVSEYIIQRHKQTYPPDSFTTDINKLPSSDLLLCMDVLFHVIEDSDLEKLLQQIEKKWTKYLAITAYERDQADGLGDHVKVRKFDYKRFGEPIIREVVEEDGKKYFYLFKRPLRALQTNTGPESDSIDLSKVSCCLITKEAVYPQQILDEIKKYPFGEILILTNSDSPYNKHKLFQAAKFDHIYYQDDDAICPIRQLSEKSIPALINVAMKPGHYEQYKNTRMTMGLGWGAIFPKKVLDTLQKYTDKYGEDEIYKRETERILTYLNYPQNRMVLPIIDLPSATAEDRLWRQPEHYPNISIVEERCASLMI